jgi:hypothetical protein
VRPVARDRQGVANAQAASPREAASTTGSGGVSASLPAVVLIIFVVTTVVDRGDRRRLVI